MTNLSYRSWIDRAEGGIHGKRLFFACNKVDPMGQAFFMRDPDRWFEGPEGNALRRT